jgi:two-component system OmpR family response regulator
MNDHQDTILVVEDEDPIRDLVSTALRFQGYRVETAETGRDALRADTEAAPDLIILDVNLPDLDGFEVIRRLRADGRHVPVVFLTARDAPDDLRTGFTRGGDDYLTKPFSLEELLLRIEAVLRRTRNHQPEPSRLAAGDVVLDQDTYRAWRGETEISLSPTEFRLFRYLLLNRDRVVSKAQILDHVWDYDFDGDQSAVETYISYLRRKLNDRDAQLIQTVRGFGYTLRTPRATSTPVGPASLPVGEAGGPPNSELRTPNSPLPLPPGKAK